MVGYRYSSVSPIYMSNDHLEPFNYHNIAFKRCADIVSLGRLDCDFSDIIDSWKLVGWGKMGFKAQTCWTNLLAFWGVWNRSRILNFGPDRLFFRFSRALIQGMTFFHQIVLEIYKTKSLDHETKVIGLWNVGNHDLHQMTLKAISQGWLMYYLGCVYNASIIEVH